MQKLPFEIRTIGPYNHEHNTTLWYELSQKVIDAQRAAFTEEGPGLQIGRASCRERV